MTDVAIVWHMHQPFYEDLVTHEHILPWVRLHALKDYYGMVAVAREFPNVRMTFNLVPSLLVQLEAFARGEAQDRFLALGLKPAAELTESDRAFVVEHFFHAQRQRMIDPRPRYAELLAMRGNDPVDADSAARVARRFSVDDLRDLQVWEKLAWIDPVYLAGDARVRALVEKDRSFTEDDKRTLREVELEILAKVIPEYRAAADAGQIEISTSPFYHPILPLLCDTDVYLRTHPQSRMPRRRFVHPEDAEEQLRRARACHLRLFEREPVGLWPSEGSVSDAMVPLAAAAGFRWMATDEQILGRTLGVTFGRDGQGHLQEPEQLYRLFTVRAGGAEIACAFRDHVLSDLIGFTYASWTAEAAADDFVARLVEGGRRFSARSGGEEAFIPIILDGENAWEHFDGGGRPFLRALYQRLSAHPEIRTVTMADASARPGRPLAGIFPGSWIDANFYIWIGHADDQRAWGQLADARAALEAPAPGVGDTARAQAREEVLVAEGSDWFWWYGDDHSSPDDLAFDDLFRRHLRNAYTILQRAVPDELFVSNITTGAAAVELSEPTGLVHPTLDGEDTSYFEWLGAGGHDVRDVPGAMHRTDGPASVVRAIRYGFDTDRLYVRIDAARSMVDLLAEGSEFSLLFLRPENLRLSVRQDAGRLTCRFWERQGATAQWALRSSIGATAGAGTLLEIAVPLADLGVSAGAPLSFLVTVQNRDGAELERHPSLRAIDTEVPDERFQARNWTA